MCNRGRLSSEPYVVVERFGATWAGDVPNRWPIELAPRGRAPVIRSEAGARRIDVMSWDVLGGQAAWPMTIVRNLALPQWRCRAGNPERRCLVPLTEFCEWTPIKRDVGGGKPIKQDASEVAVPRSQCPSNSMPYSFSVSRD